MPKKARPKFNYYELAILSFMRRNRKHAYTTNEIADKVKMNWNTTEKVLRRLFERGYVKRGKIPKGRVVRWKLVAAYERKPITGA